jgi:NitT/TauT family transport system permease protein
VLVNTLRGLTSVRPESIELMRSYAAGQAEVFRRVRIPSALPFIFTGLKVATVLSMIGAIVGDYFGGSTLALGVQIENSISLFDFPLGWAAIVVASGFGIAFYATVSVAERFAVRGVPSTRE